MHSIELVSNELNHLTAILHVYAGGLMFMKYSSALFMKYSSAFLRRPKKFAHFDIYLVNVKTMRKIAQIFVACSEKLNFKKNIYIFQK